MSMGLLSLLDLERGTLNGRTLPQFLSERDAAQKGAQLAAQRDARIDQIISEEKAAADQQAAQDREQMLARIYARKRELQETTVMTNSPLAAQEDAQRRHEIMQRLDKAERLLTGDTNG
jgi:hypothetical protein